MLRCDGTAPAFCALHKNPNLGTMPAEGPIPLARKRGPSRGMRLLYHAYELQRAWLSGASAWASIGAELMSNPRYPAAYWGMGPIAAASLEVFAHATQPRYEYRHQWKPGDLVIWDNRSVMHQANADYDPTQLRYLYRIMLQGAPLQAYEEVPA